MDERAELRELFEAKKKRLYELQRKEARMGYDTPVHNLTEIKEIKEEIHELESRFLVMMMVLLPAMIFLKLCALPLNS
jgi:orotidine-5'-phosphate decarboxylase